MVRAGVVRHPAEWEHGGYHEIQGMRRRNTILALDALADAAEVGNPNALIKAHREWVEDALASEAFQRNDAWTRSLAVGSPEFVLKTKEMLGARGKGRDIARVGNSLVLRECQESYEANSTTENRPIAPDNAYSWNAFS
jgi:putative transposase